ncbi:hypothetical protein [Acuticoccus kandeliae]|uniref:hypothetical protein n=1 Tax=Acuticoccus kandeliae TaxID=2073160 RepID=UPI001FE65AF0|nr:hypothetical protein [Acuticoccus kandeliae]
MSAAVVTMGIVVVPAIAASVTMVPGVRIMSTSAATSSATSAGSRSGCSSA